MLKRNVIVIGASTGGIEALKTLAADLPAGLPAAVFIVLHIGAHGNGMLPQILERAGKLPASNARDLEKFETGRIYVAPPDHHLLLEPSGHMRVTRGPKENRCRPAVDPLFRSAALAFGPQVTGVVLTGWLDDGTAGLWAIRECGGMTIVQHPEEALAPSMPESALRHVEVQHCVRLQALAPLLAKLAGAPADEKGAKPVSEQMRTEVKIAEDDTTIERGATILGDPSLFVCPECHGALLQIKEGSNFRFRCYTGHAYSLESLLAEFGEKVEESLWNAIRAVEESAMLMEKMAEQLSGHQHHGAVAALQAKAAEAHRRAGLVRQAVMTHEKVAPLAEAAESGESNPSG